MRTRRSLLVLLAALVAAAGWFVLAPPSVGGSTSYVVTHGTSMLPAFHTGDLALVRTAERYGPGDVIAYRSPTLHTVVLHRVVARDGDALVTKGDNNGWRDPDHPTRDLILGRLWVHVPKAGLVLLTLRQYAVPAVLLFLLSAGGATATRSRRRRRGGTVHRRTPSRYLTSPLLMWAAVVFVAAAVLGVFAFTRTTGPAATPRYSQQIGLGYAADGDPAVYDGGRVRTGDPVFLSLTPSVDVVVDYVLSAPRLDYAGGRIGLVARLSAANGWQRTVTLAEPRSFSGPRAHLTTRVDLAALRGQIRAMQHRTGSTDGSFTLEFVPQVHATTTVDGRSAAVEYAPAMRFQLQPTQLILDDGGRHTRGDPVTSATAPSAVAASAQLTLLGRSIPVKSARVAAVGLAVIALVLAGAGLLWRPDALDPVARLGRPVIPVDAAELERPAVEVASLDALLDIAERYDRPLLHARTAGATAYLVEEDGTWYRHRVRTAATRRGPVATDQA